MDMFSRLRYLFAKYLRRECTADEIRELIVLLQQVEAEESLDEEMQLLWDEARKNKIRHNVDWDNMYASIVNSGEQADVLINRATNRRRTPYLAAAAVFILIVCLPVYLFIQHASKPKAEVNAPAVAQGKIKPEGTRQTIHLPDGSKVVLNTESKLNYPAVFNSGRRDVYLTGEGYFDVYHQSSKPFFVHIGKLVVKVLGTAFNIKAYPQSNDIEVTVTRGKVQVLKENKSLGILTASQQISFINQSELVTTKKVDTASVIGWKPAEIYYNDLTMEEAAVKLEKQFDISIEFANAAIKNCRVSATFSADVLPDEILAVICAVSKCTYQTIDNKIIINGKGCN